jgi:hypothetical protein
MPGTIQVAAAHAMAVTAQVKMNCTDTPLKGCMTNWYGESCKVEMNTRRYYAIERLFFSNNALE